MNIFSHLIFLILSRSCLLLDTQVIIGNGTLISQEASDEAHDHVPVFQFFDDSIPTTPTFPWFLQANQLKKVQKHRAVLVPATLGSGYRLYQLGKKLNMTGDSYALNATHRRIIHPDEEHDEPGICASQLYDPVRALFRKPNITNLFQIISAVEFINWERFSAKVLEFVNVTGKTYQSQYRIKEFEYSETIDVGALYPNFIEISKQVMWWPAQLWYTEGRRPVLTTMVPCVASRKLDAAVGDVAIQERHDDEAFSLNYTSEWSLILVITISSGLIVFLTDKLQSILSRMVMVVGLFVALILSQSYNSILSSMLTAQRLAPATKDVATLKYADFSHPYTKSGMKSVVPSRSRLPIQLWQADKRGRTLTSRPEPIRVGVPAHSMFQQFVKVETDPKTNVTSYDGFSVEVFEEAMKIADVNNDLTYKYYSFDGEYDDLVKQLALGNLDVVVGDLSILEERHKYADFSQAYTELGMVLVVPIRSRLPIQMWLLMNPFTTELWSLILAITIFSGFIAWLIERHDNPGFRSGTVWNQIATVFWPVSTTLFTLSADKLQSILSRMVMVVWLFVALILTQSYTSILSSMLTSQRLAPATKDVATLKKMNATVGYCRESFLKSYMINVLGFDSANIKKYSSTHDYAKALKTGEIAGIFLEVPSAKVFLAQYCKSFMRTEKIFKVGGYGFAFKKNFPLLLDINKAILKIFENGKLQELEERYINSEKCAEPVLSSNDDAGVGFECFTILFVLTGGTSTVALAIYVIRHIICFLNSTLKHNNLFKRVSDFTKRLIKYRRPSSAGVINIENPGNPPDATYSGARQPISRTIDTESLEDHLEAPDPDNKV